MTVWMSHGDQVTSFPPILRPSPALQPALRRRRHRSRPFYGVQFHPEVTHTPYGSVVLKNFLYHICGCTGDGR